MRFHIDIENKDEVVRWLERLKNGTDDAKPFWKALTPTIIKFVDTQFDYTSDAKKGWRSLTAKYKAWKAKKGFYPGIGTMTGTLREGAGEQAKKKYRKKELLWSVNKGLSTGASKRLGDYAGFFHKDRPVYDRIALRLDSFLGIDIKKFNSGSHNSITYNWLRDELRKLQ